MRNVCLALLLGASALVSPAFAQDPLQSGAADLCREVLAYAEKKVNEPPKDGQAQPATGAPAPRVDGQGTGTQGGGSVASDASKDTSAQSSAPTTAPVSSGAAPEAASSPHATDGKENAQGTASGDKGAFKLAGGLTLHEVRETAGKADRQGCRDTVQTMRRAGGDLPADLIALAAYEPDPAKRK